MRQQPIIIAGWDGCFAAHLLIPYTAEIVQRTTRSRPIFGCATEVSHVVVVLKFQDACTTFDHSLLRALLIL